MVRSICAGLPDEESLLIFTYCANPASSDSCLFLLLTWLCEEMGDTGDDRQGSLDTDLSSVLPCYMLNEVRY